MKGKKFILAKETDDLRSIIRPDEMLISGYDVAFAGAAIGSAYDSLDDFSAKILALAHIVSRIVLSDRIVITGDIEGLNKPNSSYLWSLLKTHCNTLLISADHRVVAPIINECMQYPEKAFNEGLVSNVTEAEKLLSPWGGDVTGALLGEYAVSNFLGVQFAPNPFLSKPIAEYSLTEKVTSEQLMKYLEDLRHDTAKEINLYEELNIYDLNVPAIFSAVIRESNKPEDVIFVASQMNNEAKAFRSWSRSLDMTKGCSRNKFEEQLKAAKYTLLKLGTALDIQQTERAQVSTGNIGISLPAPTLNKFINYLDVDIGFIRPRHFLLNLLSSTMQLKRLSPELSRVFRVDDEFAKNATGLLLKKAEQQKG